MPATISTHDELRAAPRGVCPATLQVMVIFPTEFGEWKPVSRVGGTAWLCFYGLFLIYAAAEKSGFLFLDYVNLMIHEAGHMFFGWLGYTITILGGTLAELLVPLLCGAYFFVQRETAGCAFCAFWFFENFPYIGTYMADARDQALPLVGSGDHDWNILFGQWGLLWHDRQIGATMKFIGWVGMIAVAGWLAWMTYRPIPDEEDVALEHRSQLPS